MKTVIENSITIFHPNAYNTLLTEVDWQTIMDRIVFIKYDYEENNEVMHVRTNLIVPEYQTNQEIIQHILNELSTNG